MTGVHAVMAHDDQMKDIEKERKREREIGTIKTCRPVIVLSNLVSALPFIFTSRFVRQCDFFLMFIHKNSLDTKNGPLITKCNETSGTNILKKTQSFFFYTQSH